MFQVVVYKIMAAYTTHLWYLIVISLQLQLISVPIQFEEDKSTKSMVLNKKMASKFNEELWCHRAVSLSEKWMQSACPSTFTSCIAV